MPWVGRDRVPHRGTLHGTALIGAWTLEAVALRGLARRRGGDELVCRFGGLAFLGAAVLLTLVHAAPPSGLVRGVDSLGQAALALGAVAAGALWSALASGHRGQLRQALYGAAAVALLYLASLAIITAFQPAPGAEPLLDLSVRQQRQVLLSALWGVVGVLALLAGLRGNSLSLRTAALALLLVTVAKVFLYDLSTLTSIYRVASFFVLGGLLLGGAFAYQRLRPPPAPDLRSVHPSQR